MLIICLWNVSCLLKVYIKPCLHHRMQQRRENRNKGRLTVRRHLGRSQGQTAKRWMKTHKCVWRQNECLCIQGVASINWPKPRPIPSRQTHLTILRHGKWGRRSLLLAASYGAKHVWPSQRLIAAQPQTELLTGNEFSSCVSFIYAGYSLCENANVFLFVCTLMWGISCVCVWPEWIVEQKRVWVGLSWVRTWQLSDKEMKKNNNPKTKKGSPNWCMTCVAFWHRERLSWFVQRRRFVTVLILW